jgi:hypothetical protein
VAVVTIHPLKMQAGMRGETAELTLLNGGWLG